MSCVLPHFDYISSGMYFSSFSITVKRQHNKHKKVIIGELLRGSESESMAIMEGSTAAGNPDTGTVAEDSQSRGREKRLTGKGMGFQTLKVQPSDTLPPTRPHLLILLKWFHQLGTKYSNT